MNEARTLGLEGNYFFLGAQGRHFAVASDGGPGSPVITRPFFNVLTSTEDAEIVAAPGLASGGLVINTSSRLQSFEVNSLCNPCCGCGGRVDAIVGFRYLDLDESIGISIKPTLLPTTVNLGPAVGPARPAFTFKDTDFWAQSVNFSLEVRF